MLERVYSRVGHLGRKKEFEEHKGSNQRIQEWVLTRPRRCSKTRTERRSIWEGRIAREVYSKKTIWVVR